jgi:hypothetical protein
MRWNRVKEAAERWRLSKEIEPGHRFQTRYSDRRSRKRGETSRYGRLFNLVSGLTLILAGFAFIPTPGPSYIIIVIGTWMLASESLSLARFFDRLEVRLRKLGLWIKARWSTSAKVWVALVCVTALGFGIYSLVSSG